MRLHFGLSFPRNAANQTEVQILSSKLRVFKFEDHPLTGAQGGDNTITADQAIISNQILDSTYQYVTTPGLTLSLYKYQRPLQPNRRSKYSNPSFTLTS